MNPTLYDTHRMTMAEAALLTRLAANHTKEIRGLETYVRENGEFHGSLIIGKGKGSGSDVPHRFARRRK